MGKANATENKKLGYKLNLIRAKHIEFFHIEVTKEFFEKHTEIEHDRKYNRSQTIEKLAKLKKMRSQTYTGIHDIHQWKIKQDEERDAMIHMSKSIEYKLVPRGVSDSSFPTSETDDDGEHENFDWATSQSQNSGNTESIMTHESDYAMTQREIRKFSRENLESVASEIASEFKKKMKMLRQSHAGVFDTENTDGFHALHCEESESFIDSSENSEVFDALSEHKTTPFEEIISDNSSSEDSDLLFIENSVTYLEGLHELYK